MNWGPKHDFFWWKTCEKRLWFHETERVVDCLVGEPLEGSLSWHGKVFGVEVAAENDYDDVQQNSSLPFRCIMPYTKFAVFNYIV